MPLDPFTGKYLPYDGSSPDQAPLGAFGALSEAQPGFIQGALLTSSRGANTMMYGGFDAAKRKGLGLTTGSVNDIYLKSKRVGDASDLTPIGRLMTRNKSNYNPIVKPALRNLTPKGIFSGQYSDLSIFSPLSQNRYSPSGFMSSIMNTAVKSERTGLGNFLSRTGMISDADLSAARGGGADLLTSGFFSSMQATSRVDALEKKLVKAVNKGNKRAVKNISEKLGRVDKSTEALLMMNNPSMVQKITVTGTPGAPIPYKEALSETLFDRRGVPASQARVRVTDLTYSSTRINPASGAYNPYTGAGNVGMRGNLMVSGLGTTTMQTFGGFFRGAAGFGGEGGLSVAAQRGANKARLIVGQTLQSMDEAGFKALTGTQKLAGTMTDDAIMGLADDFLRGKVGVAKTAQLFKATRAAGASGRGVAAVMGARGVQAAAKFAGPVGWVMLAYDAGRLAGRGMSAGINLAKDAMKSFQGSIYKPAFGMGYVDNEIAATSRARGVMAIQNSRLNARSVLGSEGAMMAAHFG